MRRATLGGLSPAQLNARARPPARGGGGKQARVSLPHAPPAKGNGRSSLSHRASMHGRGSQARTDPRPIGDKNFQLECIRTLMFYLTTHGYTSVVSQKLLVSPSAKEITGIIHFLFKQVDPNVKLVKIDEDVPAMFKRLGYPFQINKSALYAAGSPQTWPGLLAALTWLVNLLVYEESAQQEKEQVSGVEEQLSGDGGGKVLFEYAAECYNYFMKGLDEECEALDESFLQHFVQEIEDLAKERDKAEGEHVEWQERLQQLQSNPLDALEAEKADLSGDVEKLVAVVTSFQEHTLALAKKVEEKKADLATRQTEKAGVERENVLLKEKVDAQQVKSVDYELMAKESQRLGLNLQSVQAEVEELKVTEWDCEVQVARKLKDLEAAVNAFNDLARRLEFRVGEEEMEFELSLNPRSDKVDEIIVGDLKGTVKPKIAELKSLSEEMAMAEHEERLAFQQKLYECNKAKQELVDKISAQTSQNKKLEAKCKAMKDRLEDDLARISQQKQNLLQEVADSENRLRSIQADCQKRVADFNEKVQAMNQELERDASERFQIVEMCMSHKEYTSSFLKKLLHGADTATEDLTNAARWRQVGGAN